MWIRILKSILGKNLFSFTRIFPRTFFSSFFFRVVSKIRISWIMSHACKSRAIFIWESRCFLALLWKVKSHGFLSTPVPLYCSTCFSNVSEFHYFNTGNWIFCFAAEKEQLLSNWIHGLTAFFIILLFHISKSSFVFWHRLFLYIVNVMCNAWLG